MTIAKYPLNLQKLAMFMIVPKVVVVVPVKNDAKRLAVLLESLSLQTVPHVVVVVDNGSTDGSSEVATAFGATVREGPGMRVGALRNLGVRSTTDTEIIAFCDSDHEVPNDWLSSGLQTLTQVDAPSIVGAYCLPPPEGTWVQRVWAIHRLRVHKLGRFDIDWLGAGNMFLRRSDFVRVGGFSEELIAAEDVDLCHRIRAHGGRVVCDPTIRNVHHGEPRTLSQFFRKEYWRGSSGLKAWFSQGCPSSDLPSLLWPLWHLMMPIVAVILMILLAWRGVGLHNYWIACAVLFVWPIPAALLALKTAGREGILVIWQLSVLYFTYGLARAGALLKPITGL